MAHDARAEVRASVAVGTGATAATNPYLVQGDDTDALGVHLTIDPSIVFEDDTATYVVTGQVRLDHYFDRYGSDESVNLGIRGNQRIDERTSLSTNASFTSSRSVSQHRFGLGVPDLDGVAPGQFPDRPIIDPTLTDLGGRVNAFGVGVSVNHLLTPVSAIEVGGRLGLSRLTGGTDGDFKSGSLTSRYTRRLDERVSIRGSLDGGFADYLGRRTGDGKFLTALGGVEYQLSDTVFVSGELGVTSSWVKRAAGGTENRLGLAAGFDLCQRDERTNLCAFGSRRMQPTSIGLSTVSSLGLSYGRQVSQEGRVSLSGSYGRTDNIRNTGAGVADGRRSVLGISATYSHDLSDRVFAYVSPGFSSISNRGTGGIRNYQGMVGISVRLGSVR